MNLENLSRKELQALAKQHGVKANLSTAALIEQLAAILQYEEPKEEEVESITEPEVEVEAVVPAEIVLAEEVIAPAPEVAKETRKSILVFEEAPGPFTVAHHEESVLEEAKIQSVEDAKIGDVIEVLEGEIWEAATIKRVNKVSFRVALVSTGREVTVKMVDCRPLQAHEEAVMETIEHQEIAETANEVIPQQNVVEEVNSQMECDVNSNEEECKPEIDENAEEEESDGEESHEGDEDEETECEEEGEFNDDSITIPDEELIAGLMDCENDEEDVEGNDNEMTADELFVPQSATKSLVGEKRKSTNFDKTPKKSRTSELPPWYSCTKAESNRFEIGVDPKSPKKNLHQKKWSTIQQPDIVPKQNNTLKLRLEAMQKKNANVSLLVFKV